MFSKGKKLKEMFPNYDFYDSIYGDFYLLIGNEDLIFINKRDAKKVVLKEIQPERITQIDDLEVYQDGKTIKCGNGGKVLAGGITFGLLGALVGANAKHKEIDYVTSLGLNIYADGKLYNYCSIKTETKKNSFTYRISIETLNSLRAKLLKFQNTIEDTIVKDDIITQIKALADLKEQGVLTEEEFTKKKTELLAKI